MYKDVVSVLAAITVSLNGTIKLSLSLLCIPMIWENMDLEIWSEIIHCTTVMYLNIFSMKMCNSKDTVLTLKCFILSNSNAFTSCMPLKVCQHS